MYKIITLFFILLILLCNCDISKINDPEFETLEEEIDYLVEPQVQVGMIVGIIDSEQNDMILSYGTKALGTKEKPDENTVFDIGSMTKTFTAILLADTYLQGYYTDDTVSHYLPDGVTLPSYNGTEITFGDLATHSSGLPRSPHTDGQTYPIPDGFDPLNPYWVYTAEDVYDYLTNYCVLEFEPGTYWNYSNTGFGLLGHIVGLVDGTSYETVLTRDIFNELEMNRSSLFLTADQLTNYSLGYNSELENVPYFIAKDIFQGTGFIKSCLSDLFIYLKANMGQYPTQLDAAMNLAHQPILHQGSMGEQALAWFIKNLDDEQEVIYTGGDTIGHSSYMGFNNVTQTGVIILSNCAMHGLQLTLGEQLMKAIPKY
jgi:CubicO group peptidase (beta-lactamase class C family)